MYTLSMSTLRRQLRHFYSSDN